MLRIKARTGGGDWQYFVPHTGHNLKAGNIHALIRLIREHLDANDFKDAVITEDEIENYNALRFKDKNPDCCYETTPTPIRERKFTLADIVRFTRTLLINLAHKGARVAPDEANRRGAICAGCAYNIATEGCSGCSSSGIAAATVGFLVGEHRTAFDEKLNTCQFCGCFNKAQIWFPLEDLQAGMEPELREQLPDYCWKK